MSRLRKSILLAALTLTLALGSAAPASGQNQGIWAYLPPATSIEGPFHYFSISLINLTDHRLLITENSFSLACKPMNAFHHCYTYQSNPFEGDNTLNLDPYRTAIWKSHESNHPGNWEDGDNGWGWTGHLTVQPEGMDNWAVTLNTRAAGANNGNPGYGTWVYLDTVTDFSASGWSQAWNTFSPYGIWVTPNFLDYTNQNPPSTMGNVMTLSGKEVAVSLYTGTTDNAQVTLVFRQNFYSYAASDTLDQSDTEPWKTAPTFGSGVYLNNYNESRMAQIVTAGTSGILGRVSVYIDANRYMNTRGSVGVSIQTVSNGVPSGTEIGSGTIPSSALPLANPGQYGVDAKWVSAKIFASGSSSLAMTPGTQYAIVLSAGNNQLRWYASGDFYSGGYTVFDYATGWGSFSGADALFKTYIVPPTAPGDDYVGWPLSFADNAGSSVPLP